ncbi:MAG: DUF4401 domain-containing protein [Caldilineaceae bacterium]
MSTTPLRLGDLFAQLTQYNLAPRRSDQPLPPDLSGANDAESSPWYIKALVGIAAWIAAIFLGIFFGAAGLIESMESMLIWGAVLTVVAIVLKRLVRNSIFWGQLAFAVILAGQGLLIGGFAWWSENATPTALFVVGLEVVVFALYPDALHRMVSILAITGALAFVLYDQEMPELIHGLTLLLAAGAVTVWQQEFRLLTSRWFPFRAPLGYGLVLSLFGVCLLSLLGEYGVTYWWVSAVVLALVLLYLAFTLLQELGRPLLSPVGLWAVGAVVLFFLPAYQTPGILAAVIALLLGYWRANTLLTGLATLFLLFFLSAYYYNLDITLLNKSYILMGTGAVLLVVRFLFHRVVGEQHGNVE